jgi:hypothetical protein
LDRLPRPAWIAAKLTVRDLLTPIPSPQEQVRLIRTHLARAGKARSRPARLRVFVAVQGITWTIPALVGGWDGLADVTHWDWADLYNPDAPDWHRAGRLAFNADLLRQVAEAHRKTPFDVFFSYLSGYWVSPETIRAIGDLGIVTVNISLDDLPKFRSRRTAGVYAGCVDIAPEYDLCITTQASADTRKYVAVGARPLFLPPGCIPSLVPDSPPVAREPHVLFVGLRYGVRETLVLHMRQAGLPVQVMGRGWAESGEAAIADMYAAQSRALINLGFGYVEGSASLVGLKGRDFEAPLTGGLYLTSYNPDLAPCFEIGREIACYKNPRDLVEQARYYLAHPDEATRIGAAGRARCLRDHTWHRRFETLLSTIYGEGDEAA